MARLAEYRGPGSTTSSGGGGGGGGGGVPEVDPAHVAAFWDALKRDGIQQPTLEQVKQYWDATASAKTTRLRASNNNTEKRMLYRFLDRLSTHQLIYSSAGLILGLACIISGTVLLIRGIAGSGDWVAKIAGAESQLTDATPGAILFVIGLFIVWITRFKFSVHE